MFLEFLSDRTTHTLDRQYMLGPSLLVAPVFVPKGEETEYYLPAGRWTSLFDPSRTATGPVWINEVVPLDEIPVWIRPNTVLLMGPEKTKKPDYDYTKGLEVQVYEIVEGATLRADVPAGEGKRIAGTVVVKREQNEVTVQVESGTIGLASVSLFLDELKTKKVQGSQELAAGAGARVAVKEGEPKVVLKLRA